MIVVSVSRRPLVAGSVAANVLEHGTGAMNIDGCRIAHGADVDLSEVHRQHAQGGHTAVKGAFDAEALVGKEIQMYKPGGRWPSNLILQHLPGCTKAGTTQVRAKQLTAGRRTVKWGVGEGDSSYEKGTGAKFATEDGTEPQPVWECAAGCPVPDIDDQSGVSKSSGGRAYQNTNDMYSGGWAHKGTGVPIDPGFGDVGGASRYYKQVGGANMGNTGTTEVPKDLLDYLHTLITPTHVGGETLIALDIDAVDWAAIPDAKYHGVIARGEPTPEQTEHLWRVVKPGAHVLLIAPDSCPTGHRGACSLEDRGFEIRDAILWVREAGKLHYVPKANSRERNEGCEKLAAKRKGAPIYELRESILEDESARAELQEALIEAGVDPEAVNTMEENGLPKDKIPKDFLSSFKVREGSGKYGNHHPTVKPKLVMQRLLEDIPRDKTVLDPFMGSGSTALACHETRHNFIGIERETEYIEVADARVRFAITQIGDAPELVSEAPPPDNKPMEAHGELFDMFGE